MPRRRAAEKSFRMEIFVSPSATLRRCRRQSARRLGAAKNLIATTRAEFRDSRPVPSIGPNGWPHKSRSGSAQLVTIGSGRAIGRGSGLYVSSPARLAVLNKVFRDANPDYFFLGQSRSVLETAVGPPGLANYLLYHSNIPSESR
jgi:hypothetical protein